MEEKDFGSGTGRERESGIVFGRNADTAADAAGKFACDQYFTALSFTEGFCRLTGTDFTNFTASGCKTAELVPPEDRVRLYETLSKNLKTGSSFSLKHSFVNGEEEHWVKAKFICSDELYQGKFPVVYALYTDITDIMKENQAMKSRHELFNRSYDAQPSGVAWFDVASTPEFSFVNKKGLEILGFDSLESFEASGMELKDFVYPEDAEKFYGKHMELINSDIGKNEIVHRIVRADGAVRWISTVNRVERAPDGEKLIYVIFNDITEDREKDLELESERKKIDLALADSELVIWDYDILAHRAILQPKAMEYFRTERIVEDVPFALIRSGCIHTESVEEYKKLHELIENGAESAGTTIRMIGKNGEDLWFKLRLTTIFDDDHRPIRAVGCGTDISEYVALQNRYNSEQKYLEVVQGDDLLGKCVANITADIVSNYVNYKGLNIAGDGAYSAAVYSVADDCATDEMKWEFTAKMSLDSLKEAYNSGNTTSSIEYQRYMKDGSCRWVRTNVKMFQNPDSKDIMGFMYTHDIDKAKTLQTALESVAEQNYDYVGIADRTSGSFYTLARSDNPYVPCEYSENYDLTVHEFAELHKNFFPTEEDYLTVRDGVTMEKLSQVLSQRDIYEFTVKLWNEQRTRIHTYRMCYSYIDKKSKMRILISRSDITEMMSEEQRRQDILRSALAQAENASNAKSDFLSRMSHEIRTPMNAIIGMTALAAQYISDPEQVSDCISKVGLSARYLLSLINDILDMSRIESGKVVLKEEEIPFEEFIAGVNNICYEQATEKGVQYDAIVTSFTEDTYIGDAMKLQQILINIISNAVKFTPAGGRVQFMIHQERVENSLAYMRFTVNDTGIGINEEFLPKLFDPFEQGHSGTASNYGGTGLGLAICKNLVTIMGGRINVNSIEGVGSEFVVELPLKTGRIKSHNTKLRQELNLSSMNALIVDDEVIICEHTKSILEDMGMKAEWVESGHRAVAVVKEKWNTGKYYDVIFVDWKMPEMDGIETTRQIRSIVGPDVTIIIMTAYDWASIEADAKRAGVNMIMTKPLFRTSLISAFHRIYLKEEEKKPQEKKNYDFSGKRALLVEDHVLNIEVARRLLESKNMTVEVVENGLESIEAFTMAEEGYYDVILMDIRMPVMDGLTAARSIRQLKKHGAKTIPIIAMSANAFDEDVEKSRLAGMNAHLAKPIEPELLFKTLDEYLK